MGEGEQSVRRELEGMPAAARLEVGDAMSSYDSPRIAEALGAAVQEALSPLVALGFIVEPDGEVSLRHLVVDPAWQPRSNDLTDFSWVEPLLGRHPKNGASLIGPPAHGASRMAAVMDLGDHRIAYFVIVGEYADPERAKRRLGRIAGEAGTASQMIARSNARAADLAALRERERLSRDLHDSLSQSLWSLSMLSETADSMIDPDDPLHAVIRQIAETSLTTQEEMRSLLINLRTAEPSRESIVTVLETLAADFAAANDVEVIASIADADAGGDLESSTLMALRRIAEEALNNVGRHANASKVAVLFDTEPAISLRIADDGDGFDAKPVKGHLGLRVMRERAAEIGFGFDLASSPGFGTVVTVASDLSAAPARPWSRPPRKLPARRAALAFLLAGVLCATLAFGSFLMSRSVAAGVDAVQAELDVLTVLDQRVLVARASADEATARLLEGVGVATADDVAAATEDRSIAIGAAREETQPLVDLQTLPGQYALLFLDALNGAELMAPDGQRLDQLYFEVDQMEGPAAQPSAEATTPTHSLGNLASLNQVFTFATLEMMVARYAIEPSAFDLDESTRQFFDGYVEFVRRDGGFFGPNESMPFRNGVVPAGIASVHEQAALDSLNQIIVEADLWNDDQWLRTWATDGSPPPTSIESYVERSSAAADAGRALVDSRFAARSAALVGERSSIENRSLLLMVLSAVLVVPAILSLVHARRLARRRRRAMLIDRTIDPLTGLGNRRVLDTQVAAMLRDPALVHHVVMTLDMDRFSFINDVHGSEFGDRMLEVLSVGLQGLVRSTPNVRGSAVRIGDDEFLVSLHSSEPIPVEMTHPAMNRLRSTVISAPDGQLVRCNFSYGVVTAEGSPSIDSLMTACNLELHEDKARLDSARPR